MSFRIISSRFTSDLEEQLNSLEEKFKPVIVDSITYDNVTHQYIVVARLGTEIHPCTFYNPVIMVTDTEAEKALKVQQELLDKTAKEVYNKKSNK